MISSRRKVMMHLKLSHNDNFIHDHELYEMMRSRQLYNVHKDLRKKLGRTIRGIQDAEKVHVAAIEAQRLLFVQRSERKAKLMLKLTKVERRDEDSFETSHDRKVKKDDEEKLYRNSGKILKGEGGSQRSFEFPSITRCVRNIPIGTGYGEHQRSGVMGAGHLREFLQRRDSMRRSCTQSSSLSVMRSDSSLCPTINENDPTISSQTEKMASVRLSRIHHLREYTKLLDKRVREFRA